MSNPLSVRPSVTPASHSDCIAEVERLTQERNAALAEADVLRKVIELGSIMADVQVAEMRRVLARTEAAAESLERWGVVAADALRQAELEREKAMIRENVQDAGLHARCRALVVQLLDMAKAARDAKLNGTWSASLAAPARQTEVGQVMAFWEVVTDSKWWILICEGWLKTLDEHVREPDEPDYCSWCADDDTLYPFSDSNEKYPCHVVVRIAHQLGIGPEGE